MFFSWLKVSLVPLIQTHVVIIDKIKIDGEHIPGEDLSYNKLLQFREVNYPFEFETAQPLSEFMERINDAEETDKEFYFLREVTDTKAHESKMAPHSVYKKKNRLLYCCC